MCFELRQRDNNLQDAFRTLGPVRDAITIPRKYDGPVNKRRSGRFVCRERRNAV
jgi:hypothetical protein